MSSKYPCYYISKVYARKSFIIQRLQEPYCLPEIVCVICVSVVACSAEKKVVFDPSMSGVVPPGDILTGRAAEMKHEFFQINCHSTTTMVAVDHKDMYHIEATTALSTSYMAKSRGHDF